MSTSRWPTSTAPSGSTTASSASRSCSTTASRRPSCPQAATTTTSASTPGRASAGRGPPRGTTGLYHTAFLYPTRRDLADALRRLIEAGIPLQGASDHGVSEALYLDDPDGNGVELYWDKPQERWPRRPDGSLEMYTRRLDLEALLRELAD